MAVIGIDLGTTYCAAARYIDEQAEIIHLNGQPTLPSVVGVLPSGKVSVGWPAKRNQAKNPQDTVVEVKREMGKDTKIALGKKEYAPQEISAMILKEIKRLALDEIGDDINGVVITCPAYFKEPQREATAEAGKLAGMNVLRVLNEPTSAAVAYGLNTKDSDEENLFLVYDLGGGTFDVTVIKMIAGNLDVIGTGGDPELGGGNFDDCIVNWMFEHLDKVPGYAETLTQDKKDVLTRKLKFYAEEAKIKLCGPPAQEEYKFQIASVDKLNGKPVPFTETLTMAEFESRIMELVQNSLQWIDVAMENPKEKHKFTEANITEILLVGGSTRVPLIQRVLQERFPGTPIHGVDQGINPDEIVAMGAAIIAATIDPDMEEIPDTDIDLVDVTGHTLSVEVYSAEKQKNTLHPLIPKDTPIPCSETHAFQSMGEFQPRCLIKVYQGEGEDPLGKDVTMVGEFAIEIEAIKDPIPLAIGLTLNEDGILVALAKNGITGAEVECNLQYEGSAKLSPDEVKRRQEKLNKDLEGKVGRTANLLEEEAAQAAGQPAGAAAQAQQAAPPDPSSLMNPIVRALYQQAITNFGKVSADKRMEYTKLVTEMEAAALAGNEARLMELYDPLNTILSSMD